jgi:hypothetical protein
MRLSRRALAPRSESVIALADDRAARSLNRPGAAQQDARMEMLRLRGRKQTTCRRRAVEFVAVLDPRTAHGGLGLTGKDFR